MENRKSASKISQNQEAELLKIFKQIKKNDDDDDEITDIDSEDDIVVPDDVILFANDLQRKHLGHYKQLYKFVQETEGFNPDDKGFCTRVNIDGFFNNVISKKVTSYAYNKSFLHSFEKFAINFELRHDFKVESSITDRSLEMSTLRRKKAASVIHEFIDAHENSPLNEITYE